MSLGFAVRVRRDACTVAFVFAVVLFAAPRAFAGPFTDPAAFMAAIAGLPGTTSTLDFEATSAGTTIPEGGSLGGITFTDSIGLDLIVSTGFDTTSGGQYLGVDDGGDEVFVPPGDLWEMHFAPLRALGLYLITSDPLFAGDVRLETAAGTVENSDTEFHVLGDGGYVYFLGIVSDILPFTEAQVRYGALVDEEFFVYNVDDITTVSDAATPVPEPASLLLATSGLAALWARRRSLRAKRREQGVPNA